VTASHEVSPDKAGTPTNNTPATSARDLHSAITTLIAASKRALIWANELMAVDGADYHKVDLDEVITRLQRLGRDMTKLRRNRAAAKQVGSAS
jgi:hypothetical protein